VRPASAGAGSNVFTVDGAIGGAKGSDTASFTRP
jgi:hypothetical protein